MPFIPVIIIFAFGMLCAQEQQSEADKRRELLGNVNVSKVNSMDEVKGSYKSPKKAMFMSLLLPGSGQMYVGGQSRYIRGTFYLAEEAALIFGLYYHSIYKYDKQVKKYKDFAGKDTNFSVSRYERAMSDIFSSTSNQDSLIAFYNSERQSYCKAFYGDESFVKNCVDNFGKNKDPRDDTPIYDETAYYRIIAGEHFMPGWKDSADYYKYIDIRKKANNLADRQAIFLGIIILNHVVSAIDAALSANAHNSSLYEEKISFLDRIRLGSDFNIGENFRVGAGLRLSF